jgi:hypothetical protein
MMKTISVLISAIILILSTGCNQSGTEQNYSTPPFIIDSHMHYEATDAWEKSFLDIIRAITQWLV